MAWIGQLQNDPALQGKIDWAKVEEIHKNWHYDQQGLSPAGATVIQIKVAAARPAKNTTHRIAEAIQDPPRRNSCSDR